MKINEILDMEKTNMSGIVLLKEGMFFRAYNRSAMRMTKNVRALKVNTKLIKYVGQMVMYCGFPDNILSEIRNLCLQKNYSWNMRGETRVDIDGVATTDEDYEAWAKGILTPDRPAVSDLSVAEEYYNLVLWFFPKLMNFPRDRQTVLADRIEKLLMENLGILTEVACSDDRADGLKAVNVRLEQLRYMVRLAKDMKYISIEEYDYFVKKNVEIGSMVSEFQSVNS